MGGDHPVPVFSKEAHGRTGGGPRPGIPNVTDGSIDRFLPLVEMTRITDLAFFAFARDVPNPAMKWALLDGRHG